MLAATWRSDLLQQLEASGAALAVCEYDGRLVHATPALLAVTMADPEGAALLSAASHLSHTLRDAMRRPSRGQQSGLHHPGEVVRPTRAVKTQWGTYVLHAAHIGEALLGPDHPLVLVRVDTPVARTCHTPASLRARFGLSAREAQVALLLADGASNARIAETLRVTVHTARRHTEHVREKLGAENRAAVARILQGGLMRSVRRSRQCSRGALDEAGRPAAPRPLSRRVGVGTCRAGFGCGRVVCRCPDPARLWPRGVSDERPGWAAGAHRMCLGFAPRARAASWWRAARRGGSQLQRSHPADIARPTGSRQPPDRGSFPRCRLGEAGRVLA